MACSHLTQQTMFVFILHVNERQVRMKEITACNEHPLCTHYLCVIIRKSLSSAESNLNKPEKWKIFIKLSVIYREAPVESNKLFSIISEGLDWVISKIMEYFPQEEKEEL